MTATVEVRAGAGMADYPVVVGRGLRTELPTLVRRHAPAHRYAVVSDSTVAPLWAEGVVEALRRDGLEADLTTFPAGETEKTRAGWSRLTDLLLASGHARDSAVVAVGGGVTGDLAGFVAATLMRGVPVVQVPTSLVAMIDASVGGKTGVDTPAGKNLVGAFHPPRLVVADPEVVGTLPREERAQGLAEALKHGAILDREYFEALVDRAEALLDADPGLLEDVVVRSVELKGDVVGRDEREGGLREILNFGHTVGHALEAASEYRLPHGSAVAIGMVLEARLGESLGVTEAGTAERLAEAVRRFELPAGPREAPASGGEGALAFLGRDKKVREGRVRCVLLTELGRVSGDGRSWSTPVERSVLAEVLGP